MNDTPQMRPARPDEAALLTRLAMSSKAHWGYDEAFLRACRDELTVGRDDIERHTVAVLEDCGVLRGFYMLRSGDRAGGNETPRRGGVGVGPGATVAPHERRHECGREERMSVLLKFEDVVFLVLAVVTFAHTHLDEIA